MMKKNLDKKNLEIILMLGAKFDDANQVIIDEMSDDDFIFHNLSVTNQSYFWNGTTNSHTLPLDLLQFHSNWEWIMQAIKFINSTHKGNYPGRDMLYTMKYLLGGGYLFQFLHPAKEFQSLPFSLENLFERVYIFAKEYNYKNEKKSQPTT